MADQRERHLRANSTARKRKRPRAKRGLLRSLIRSVVSSVPIPMIRAHHAFPIGFHLGMFGTRRASNKAGIDALGLPEAAEMATSPVAAVPEHERSRDRSAPFIAVPAAVPPGHPHPMPHPPPL